MLQQRASQEADVPLATSTRPRVIQHLLMHDSGSFTSTIWQFLHASRRERFKELAQDGEVRDRTRAMCVVVNTGRTILNFLHVFTILTSMWFVVLLSVFVALFVLFFVSERVTKQALTFVQDAEQVCNSLEIYQLTCCIPAVMVHGGIGWM
jgi:hypothetical protein